MSHNERGEGPATHWPVNLFLPLFFLHCGSTLDIQAMAVSHQCLVKHYSVRQASVLCGGGQYWVQHILCTAKARLLLVWKMADSLCCVDKLLITTNENIIHLSFINSYFWEANKQKVICHQKDDVHRPPWQPDVLAADLWSGLSWSHPKPICTQSLWVRFQTWDLGSLHVPVLQPLKTLHWRALHWPSVGLVTLSWVNPNCKPPCKDPRIPVTLSVQEVVMKKWTSGPIPNVRVMPLIFHFNNLASDQRI